MMEYDVCVIGGGPAGVMAAYVASHNSSKVILLEKNHTLLNKLLLTGGGRCNITNLKPIKELLAKYNNKNFLKNSFYTFTNEDLFTLFKDKGLTFTVEDNDRVFPSTYKSSDVVDVLYELLSNVKVKCDYNVVNISDDLYVNNSIKTNTLIITTGGITYPKTGSTIHNYKLSNHPKTPIKYGLVPLITKDDLSQIKGIAFRNVNVKYDKTTIKGDVLITHFGLTGPAILDISNSISSSIDYDLLSTSVSFNEYLYIDFTPNIPYGKLNENFINLKSNMLLRNYLKNYLPQNFINYFLLKTAIDGEVFVAQLKKQHRKKIIKYLKNFPFEITGFKKDLSKITLGGFDTAYVNPKTLESKLHKRLFFAGETLNLHGPTGGYNLKLAFSTGYLAGLSASKYNK